MNEKLTVITVTHLTDKVDSGISPPPETELIERTFTHLWKNHEGIRNCEHILIYNCPKTNSHKSIQYEQNLQEFCAESGVSFHTLQNNGLRPAVALGLQQTETEYVLFLEHDWLIFHNVQFETLLDTMDNNNNNINYVRFNKFKNKPVGWDTILKEKNYNNIDLTKTSAYSNNPHVVRTNIYKNWIEMSRPGYNWFKIGKIPDYPQLFIEYLKVVSGINVIYDRIENVLDMYYKYLIESEGFEKAHKQMGIYLYGGIGDGPFIKHIGGKNTYWWKKDYDDVHNN